MPRMNPVFLILLHLLLGFATSSEESKSTLDTAFLRSEQQHILFNDQICKLAVGRPNPVILLHSLAHNTETLNNLNHFLRTQGFCTFKKTYGAWTDSRFPILRNIGGLKSIDSSMAEIEEFIQQVLQRTGAEKVDIVGHSEGAFLSMYIPKFGKLGPIYDKMVAISPSTHGSKLGLDEPRLGIAATGTLGNNFANWLQNGGFQTSTLSKFLNFVGCAACAELTVDQTAILKLNNGQPIHQVGTKLTVIASETDGTVTPAPQKRACSEILPEK